LNEITLLLPHTKPIRKKMGKISGEGIRTPWAQSIRKVNMTNFLIGLRGGGGVGYKPPPPAFHIGKAVFGEVSARQNLL
jgi:hypothetical protein